jgi:dTDP-4-dehydrorhamnose 3,5-epimerase
MKVEKTALAGVLKITPPTIFEDFRGKYVETYNKTLYNTHGIACEFIQDDISVSRKNVLRGIHGDRKTWKLISCLHGSFYLVVVNNDPESSQYKQWASFTLSAENHQQILVPPMYGNGHLVLTDSAIFHYKQNTEYDRSDQFTILWDDPEFKIWWPTGTPILSKRDMGLE